MSSLTRTNIWGDVLHARIEQKARELGTTPAELRSYLKDIQATPPEGMFDGLIAQLQERIDELN